ncbi:MAG: hypothetical protein LBG43_07820 [Treponema sp.]|nr:hypothetical protein [Treponema sp.]
MAKTRLVGSMPNVGAVDLQALADKFTTAALVASDKDAVRRRCSQPAPLKRICAPA